MRASPAAYITNIVRDDLLPSITLSSPSSGSSSQAMVQDAVDELANRPGSRRVLRLSPGTYRVDQILQPLDPTLKYGGINIVGLGPGATIAPSTNNAKSLWWIGHNFSDWFAPKLKGISFQNITFDGEVQNYPSRLKLIRTEGDDGTYFVRCAFNNSRDEGLYIGGGTKSINGRVVRCTAYACGHPETSSNHQNLSAFNVNGLGWVIEDSAATNCGWGAEGGGTSVYFRRCDFTDAPIVLGSSSYGCCDIEFRGCGFIRSALQWGNGDGRICDVRVIDNNFHHQGVVPEGGKATNNVDPSLIGGLPWTGLRNRVEGNTFNVTTAGSSNQAVRMTQWSSLYLPYGVGTDFTSNVFNVSSGLTALVVQGGPTETMNFRRNVFNTPQQVGTAFTNSPLGAALDNYLPNVVFENNTVPSGAYLQVSPINQPGWPNIWAVN